MLKHTNNESDSRSGETSGLRSVPAELLPRLLAASYALPIEDQLRDIADEVAAWDAEGYTPKEIDRRILAWADENGFSYDSWMSDLEAENPGLLGHLPQIDPVKLWRVFGFEEWLVECIRSLAFTDEPIPFCPWSAGTWLELPHANPPMIIAIMTPLSDPDLAARQLKERSRAVFGDKAARSTRRDEVENARMLKRHRDGMSYLDIAIQNLRGQYPDIVRTPRKYQPQLKTERERVVKCVRAAQELWKERIPESSTEE